MVNWSKRKKIMVSSSMIALTIISLIAYPFIRGNTKEEIASFALKDVGNPMINKVRGAQYSEIIIMLRYFTQFYGIVFNDIGEQLISDEEFANIDLEQVKKDFNAVTALKNGPRFWTMDEISAYTIGNRRNIAGHQMNQPAILQLTPEMMNNRAPFTDTQVDRKTTFTYYAGQKVYEIISVNGDVYTMQSGSREIDPDLTINDLDSLKSRLTLPTGWDYRMRVLSEQITFNINGTATVLQDNFQNTYQKNPST